MARSLAVLGGGVLRLRSLSPRTLRRMAPAETIVLLGLLVAALFGALLAASVSLHVLLALAVCPLVLAVVWMSPRSTILGLAFWLIALGMVRRLVGSGSSSGLGDPLLLVGPAVLVLLFVVACGRGALRNRSPLANAVGLLSLLVLVEAVNPFQGGLLVGLGGLLFMLVPMLAFWVGRSLLDDVTLRRLFQLVAVLSVLSAAYGLIQQFVGFPSWDERWIASSGYVALNVGNGVTRAFGNFSSAQEYAAFLSVGLVVLVSSLRNVRRVLLPLALAAIGLVGYALVLASVRTSLVLAAAALGSMAAARVRLRPGAALLAGALADRGARYWVELRFRLVANNHVGGGKSGGDAVATRHLRNHQSDWQRFLAPRPPVRDLRRHQVGLLAADRVRYRLGHTGVRASGCIDECRY